MPELPEVETVRRGLQEHVAGRRMVDVRVTGRRTVRRLDQTDFEIRLTGRRVESFERIGKFLIARLDDGSAWMTHLRMSGQLLLRPPTAELAKHTHARVQFEDSDVELRFVDPRTFGEMWITSSELPELSHLGPDAYDELTLEELSERLSRRKSGLKTLLLDQSVTAGLGNIYTDEVLWQARLRFDRQPAQLRDEDLLALFDSIRVVLRRAVEARGSTLVDAQYVDLFGKAGEAQLYHQVYDRRGKPCSRCGALIARTKVSGRSTYFCENCQI